MQKVYDHIYMRALPLAGNPLKSINIFIIKTDEGHLIIDSGFNNSEVITHMESYLKDLQIHTQDATLFLTHMHSDHVGLASYLQEKGIKEILLSHVDGDMIKDGTTKESPHWQNIINNAHTQGLADEHLHLEDHPGFKNRPQSVFQYRGMTPGEEIKLGPYHFITVDESGHTPGMLGLYEPDHGILFCGDHILGKITPNITFWGEKYGDSLDTYIKNLEAVKKLNVQHLFSAHRFLVTDVNGRIDELITHHDRRLKETLSILASHGPSTVRDVTRHLEWDIRTKSWETFPPSQKWFAAGEAAAHLKYLRNRGLVREHINDDNIAIYDVPRPTSAK